METALIGAYDQEAGVMPSSRQDVDFRDRCLQAHRAHMQLLGKQVISDARLQLQARLSPHRIH